MIDYIKMSIDGEFPPIGKSVAVTHREGMTSQTFTADKYKLFRDGADYTLRLWTKRTGGQVLDLDFCPPKILQGHNGLGSNDLSGVVRHAVELIFREHRIPLTPDIKKRLHSGDYRLREVHVAELHCMPHAAIPALCQQIRRFGPDSLQAVPLERGVGVRLWPNSESRRVVIYDKLHYFSDKPEKHMTVLLAGTEHGSWSRLGLQFDHGDLIEYLRQGVRIECRFMSPYLVTRKLDRGSAWNSPAVARDQYQAMLKEVPLGTGPLASTVDGVIAVAPQKHGMLMALWQAGCDPSVFAPPSTYYRHCTDILKKFGLDIRRPLLILPKAVKWADLIEAENIVERAPKWSRGDGFFFNPQHPRSVRRSAPKVVVPQVVTRMPRHPVD